MAIENLFIPGEKNEPFIEKFADKLLTLPRITLFQRYSSHYRGKKISAMAFKDQVVSVGRNFEANGSVKFTNPKSPRYDVKLLIELVHVYFHPLILTSFVALGVGLCLKKYALSKNPSSKAYNVLIKNYANVERNTEAMARSASGQKVDFFKLAAQQKILISNLEASAKEYLEKTSYGKENTSIIPVGPKLPCRVIHDSLTNPLHLAIKAKRSSIARKLILSKEYGLNDPCSKGHTPLYYAVRYRQPQLVQELVANGADVNKPINQNKLPALHGALQVRSHQLLTTLLQCGANPNQENEFGITPLHIAVSSGDIKVIKALVESGADINLADKQGNTPLHHAVKAYKANAEVMRLLLSYGANIDSQNSKGMTPLMESVTLGNYLAARFLIKNKARLTTWDNQHNTLLHAAALQGNYLTFAAVFKGFKENKIPYPLNIQNLNGDTALHQAVRSKNRQFRIKLLKAGADKSIKNSEGLTPFGLNEKINRFRLDDLKEL